MNRIAQISSVSDYDAIRTAICYLLDNGSDSVDSGCLARALQMSEQQLVDLFYRWGGLGPSSFAQAVAPDHARRLLQHREGVLDAACAIGAFSSSCPYGLSVTYEVISPGIFRVGGAGLDMAWGVAPSPFGLAVVMVTEYGLSGLGLVDDSANVEQAFADLAGRWPKARFIRDDTHIASLVAQSFNPALWSKAYPARLALIGSDFEVAVWKTLLEIPCGQVVTYQQVADHIGRPKAARAVGAAVGRNPISFIVPCHRVVGASGALTGYHWGLPRKRAILAWEAGVVSARDGHMKQGRGASSI